MNKVIQTHGGPMTVEELRSKMAAHYQSYKEFVFDQLPLPDSAGSQLIAFERIPGKSLLQQALFLPKKWKYDENQNNVSNEVKRLIKEGLHASKHRQHKRADIARQLIPLYEGLAGERIAWADD